MDGAGYKDPVFENKSGSADKVSRTVPPKD